MHQKFFTAVYFLCLLDGFVLFGPLLPGANVTAVFGHNKTITHMDYIQFYIHMAIVSAIVHWSLFVLLHRAAIGNVLWDVCCACLIGLLWATLPTLSIYWEKTQVNGNVISLVLCGFAVLVPVLPWTYVVCSESHRKSVNMYAHATITFSIIVFVTTCLLDAVVLNGKHRTDSTRITIVTCFKAIAYGTYSSICAWYMFDCLLRDSEYWRLHEWSDTQDTKVFHIILDWRESVLVALDRLMRNRDITFAHETSLRRLKTLSAAGGSCLVYCGLWYSSVTDKYRVAIKVMDLKVPDPSAIVEQYEKEAMMLACANNRAPDATIKMYCLCICPPEISIVLELAKTSLHKYLKDRPNLQSRKKLELCLQVTDCLRKLHRARIVHRDFKPHNILLTFDGDWKLTDMSTCAVVDHGPLVSYERIGTPYYMSPELMVSGPKHHSFPCDVWSLAVTLWQIWEQNITEEEAKASRNYRPSLIFQSHTKPPIKFQTLIANMTHTDPNTRPSAEDVFNALNTIVAEWNDGSGYDAMHVV